jgi:parallel beta-helix repeat protein
VADGYVDGSGTGSTVGESLGDVSSNTGFTFRNNLVTNCAQGMFLEESNGATILGNTFTQMQFDPIRMVGVQDTLIEDNAFYDFFGSLYELNHDDMIQVWSGNAQQLTENLTIRGNDFTSGAGAASQTIFVNYENFGADSECYRNVRIEGNTICNAHQHGITVNHTDGVHVANKTVLYNPQSVILRADRPEGMTSPPVIWLSDVLNGRPDRGEQRRPVRRRRKAGRITPPAAPGGLGRSGAAPAHLPSRRMVARPVRTWPVALRGQRQQVTPHRHTRIRE